MSRRRRIGFSEWLEAQGRREDPIGDLAREAAADSEWPWIDDRLPVLHGHLARMHAPDEAHDALDRAWGEWQRREESQRP